MTREGDGVPESADSTDIGNRPTAGLRLRCVCRGHEESIGRIAWSPCGRFLASPSRDRSTRIWDAQSGDCLAVLRGHTKVVYTVAWSPDGQRLASGSWDGTVHIWDVKEPPHATFLFWIRTNQVNCVAWRPVGRSELLAIGAEEPAVRLLDVPTRRLNWFRGHTGNINNLAWAPDGRRLATASGDGSVIIWTTTADEDTEEPELRRLHTLTGHTNWAFTVAWSPRGDILASGSRDSTIRLWDTGSGRPIRCLEGHTARISSISFAMDGRLLASKAADGTVLMWDTDRWEVVAQFAESSSGRHSPSLAFHPELPMLATLGENDTILRIWDVDTDRILANRDGEAPLVYTSAKIVLVGESNVGKSCLATRLAEDRYPNDDEQRTTHGLRVCPVAADRLHPSAAAPEGERRDIMLWDFGGQREYRLIHQMFLHDTTLALVLIDPTRGERALDEARDWNKALDRHLGPQRAAKKLLVGAKQDVSSPLVNRSAIDALCRECGFSAYFEVSARTARHIDQLKEAMAAALDWDAFAKTSRPELFQAIRDDIESRRRRGDVVVLFDDLVDALHTGDDRIRMLLEHEIALASDANAGEEAIDAVCRQLSQQGNIADTQTTQGDRALVLRIEEVERYAGSLIVAAHNNPRGVPALEERQIGSRENPPPGIAPDERLSRMQERIVLECVAELMIYHGLCFRHEGLLVFPALFAETLTSPAERLPHSVSLFYDFTGAIDNIYASLVARLVMSETFGKGRLWPGRFEFDAPGRGVCGVQHTKFGAGTARLDLFFAEETGEERRMLFTRFVEEHLRAAGVEVREHQAIRCRGCGREIGEDVVRANIEAGQVDVVCQWCRTHTLISAGIDTIRLRDPESDQKIFALRKGFERKAAEDARQTKLAIADGAASDHTALRQGPIRILHLSDLHFDDATSPQRTLQWLLDDITKDSGLACDAVHHLVISGDVTHKGSAAGFEHAREFVSDLRSALGISIHRCVFVPGNHDVRDQLDWYELRDDATGLKDGEWVQQGDLVLVPREDRYRGRFRSFSDDFFHKLYQAPYPEEYAEQGIAYIFTDTRLQFFALNSCWEIDRFHRKRSGLHPDAVSGVIAKADQQFADAVQRGELAQHDKILRLAVWHHALAHPEMIRETDFIGHLKNNNVQVVLHGDVHEMSCDMIHRFHAKQLSVVGVGSFGARAASLPEATGRHYNMLEIAPDMRSIRVHTRQQRKPDGPWQGWYEWPDSDHHKGRIASFDIQLP